MTVTTNINAALSVNTWVYTAFQFILNRPPKNYFVLGQSALHWASMTNNLPLLRALLQAGACPDLDDMSSYTALHFSVLRHHTACARALLEAGANPNARRLTGQYHVIIYTQEQIKVQPLYFIIIYNIFFCYWSILGFGGRGVLYTNIHWLLDYYIYYTFGSNVLLVPDNHYH